MEALTLLVFALALVCSISMLWRMRSARSRVQGHEADDAVRGVADGLGDTLQLRPVLLVTRRAVLRRKIDALETLRRRRVAAGRSSGRS